MDFIEALLQQWCSVFVNSVAFGTEDLGGKRLAHELSDVGTEPVLVDMARRLRQRQVDRVLFEVLELVLVDGEVSKQWSLQARSSRIRWGHSSADLHSAVAGM